LGNINVLASCYRRLNVNLKNLNNRKILQKKIYFLQEFGFNLGYNFGFYIYGPYSTELTSDAFTLIEQHDVARNTIVRERLTDEQKAILDRLDEFIEDISPNELAHQLELLSSIHFLNNHIFRPIVRLGDMIREIEERKSGRFDREEIREAWNKLNEYDLITTEEE